jgi:hypothetical protein
LAWGTSSRVPRTWWKSQQRRSYVSAARIPLPVSRKLARSNSVHLCSGISASAALWSFAVPISRAKHRQYFSRTFPSTFPLTILYTFQERYYPFTLASNSRCWDSVEPGITEKILSKKEVLGMLPISSRTLARRRWDGSIEFFALNAKHYVYPESSILSFLEKLRSGQLETITCEGPHRPRASQKRPAPGSPKLTNKVGPKSPHRSRPVSAPKSRRRDSIPPRKVSRYLVK